MQDGAHARRDWVAFGCNILQYRADSEFLAYPGVRCKSPTTTSLDDSTADLRGVTNLWRPNMATGTVKWFNPTKGFGFIQPEAGGNDVFVHISAVEQAGLGTLTEGQRVEYEVVTERGKTAAGNLKSA